MNKNKANRSDIHKNLNHDTSLCKNNQQNFFAFKIKSTVLLIPKNVNKNKAHCSDIHKNLNHDTSALENEIPKNSKIL